MVAYEHETLRTIAERMATRHLFILPVVQAGTGRLVGLVTAEDVLQGRPKAHERETRD